jgi:FkbH-like protein
LTSGLDLDEIVAALGGAGWAGFASLRRYLAERPREARAVAQRLQGVDWRARGDFEARSVRYAVLADSGTANLRGPLLLESIVRGVIPEQYHAAPGRISHEIGDPESGLWAHRPEVVVLAAPHSEISDALLESLLGWIRELRARSQALVVVHELMPPEFRAGGIHDWREPDGPSAASARLNQALREGCRAIPDVHLVDVGRLAALSGAREWTLHKTRFLGGFAFPEELALLLGREYAAFGAALRGLQRKCLVVDLDETLWGGIVGEVGAAGVAIGGAHPGNIHQELQRVVRQLKERGVVLALNSRNNEEDAWQPFQERPEMLLRKHDFAAWRINWGDKAQNLRELSRELGLALESLVVLDDDPVARAWIEDSLPEVHVLPAQDPLDMLRMLATTRVFEGTSRTAEDALRARSYEAAVLRRQERDATADRAAFLGRLGLEVAVGRASQQELPRLSQLSQRANQWNLTARRYSEAQLAELVASGRGAVLYCTCRDRFADEGIAGLLVLRKGEPAWAVESFALSCRVLGWGVERALAAAACSVARDAGAVELQAEYVATARNRQAESFYEELGFAPVTRSGAGSTWRLALAAPPDLTPPWIRLRFENPR